MFLPPLHVRLVLLWDLFHHMLNMHYEIISSRLNFDTFPESEQAAQLQLVYEHVGALKDI